jgi:DNA-binding transcriptional regulator YiaG
MLSPAPAEIKEKRLAAGLTQTQAGALIETPLRTWQGWETEKGIRAHRKMDGRIWELWLLKLAETKEK